MSDSEAVKIIRDQNDAAILAFWIFMGILAFTLLIAYPIIKGIIEKRRGQRPLGETASGFVAVDGGPSCGFFVGYFFLIGPGFLIILFIFLKLGSTDLSSPEARRKKIAEVKAASPVATEAPRDDLAPVATEAPRDDLAPYGRNSISGLPYTEEEADAMRRYLDEQDRNRKRLFDRYYDRTRR